MVAHRSHADCSRCKRPVSGLLAWRFTAVRTWLFCALFALLTHPSSAQSVDGQKRVTAVRVPTGSVHVDGNLDDEVWRLASPVTDFVQTEPLEGASPTDPMDVRFLYDESALFVGARMSTRTPADIQAPMSRRDEDTQQAEHMFVSLDTYLDRRTAYTFGVTAAGVRFDHYHPDDDRSNRDRGFDPVWEARVRIDEGGWVAELRIPFDQLRFRNVDAQNWGLNIYRLIPGRNEEVAWSLVRRTEGGWASRFGELHGILGIQPTTRIELLPYVASAWSVTAARDDANPFDGGLLGRTGLDMKIGLGPNLTLDATVNPDFGQIEADPVEVNLTAFETFFDERRPFFLEGSRLLAGRESDEWSDDTEYFYSRRIGARPAGSAEGDFVDYPATTTTLGAAKLTGRLQTGTSIRSAGRRKHGGIRTHLRRSQRDTQPRAGGTVDVLWSGPDAAGIRASRIRRSRSSEQPCTAGSGSTMDSPRS